MNVASADNLTWLAPIAARLGATGDGLPLLADAGNRFDAILKSQTRQPDGAGESKRQQVRDAATQLVASALVIPTLASLHQSPLRPQAGPLSASVAEKRFGPMLESHYADRITKAANFGIVDRIVDRFSTKSHS